MFKYLLLFFLTGFFVPAPLVPNPNLLCGKWMAAEKNIEVLVYREGDAFKGKIIWFKNDDNSKTMEEWTDKHNPDPALRDRKLIGLPILRDMVYVPRSNSWENGKIYEAKSGKEWDAAAKINDKGELKVTGYWHIKLLGKTMTFTRVKD